jgi:hypothetical protein
MSMRRLIQAIGVGCLAWPLLLCGQATTPAPSGIAEHMVSRQEAFWGSCARPADGISSREVFAYALELCEAHQHADRLDPLFELAARMQDRSPKSRSLGNFWWNWRDGRVLDHNAVDFCMRGGSLLWLKHRDFIPAPAQGRLATLLDYAVQGCRLHKVPPSYSNIAIMNAGDLILLGEALGRLDAAEEGYARLGQVFHYTLTAGIHEFDSPTYTGVDLTGLGTINTSAGARPDEVRPGRC